MMNIPSCVYTHSKPSGEVFYVGKGKPWRPYSRFSRNKLWLSVVDEHGDFDVNIIEADMEEQEAFELEMLLIEELRESGLSLCNITNGGRGANGYRHTAETRAKISRANKGRPRSAAHCDAISLAKRGKVPKNKCKQIRCLDTNVVFESISQAARDLNISAGGICSMLKGRRKTAGGYRFEYIKGDADVD